MIMRNSQQINYSKYLPVNEPRELRSGAFEDLTEADFRRWKIFKSYLTRTPYMFHILLMQQESICPICDSKLIIDKSIIHHVDYKHLCHYDCFLQIDKPDTKRPKRTIRIANCEQCKDMSGCITRIVLIHKACHIYLHVKEGRIYKKDKSHEEQLELFNGESVE